MYYAYILKSEKDNRYYYGSCADINVRLNSHNQGKVRSTKNRRPLRIHYYEVFESKTESRKRELFFKTIDGYNWLKKHGII